MPTAPEEFALIYSAAPEQAHQSYRITAERMFLNQYVHCPEQLRVYFVFFFPLDWLLFGINKVLTLESCYPSFVCSIHRHVRSCQFNQKPTNKAKKEIYSNTWHTDLYVYIIYTV